MYTAVLDTCVLYPSLQRNFLLSLAVEGSYRPVWSSRILDELYECEQDKLADMGMGPVQAQHAAAHLVETMRFAFSDDAEVPGWERYESSIVLPDPDDRHVVAAAIAGRADAIVTANLKDFPLDALPVGVEVVHPSNFVAHNVTLDPSKAQRAISEMVFRSGSGGRPKLTEADILDTLESRYGMIDAVYHLRSIPGGP